MPRNPATRATLLPLLLAACGGAPETVSSSPGTARGLAVGDGATLVGYVHIKAFRGPGSSEPFSFVSGRGLFSALGQAASNLPSTVLPPDTCTVVPGSDRVAWVPAPPLGSPATPVSAGDEVSIRTAAARFLTLIRLSQDPAYFGGPVYTFSGLPAGLTVNVPGAPGGFPAFTGVPLPALPGALALTSPARTSSGAVNVGLNTTFTWSGPQGGEALVYLWGYSANRTAYFFCAARDDGSFAFPPDTRAALTRLGFSAGQLAEAGRVRATAVQQGGAVLFVNLYNLTSYQ